MQNQVRWNSGPPPRTGWWNAAGYVATQTNSVDHLKKYWRYWNGRFWTVKRTPDMPPPPPEHPYYDTPTTVNQIMWSDYWPESARMPRVAQNVA